MQNVVGAGRAVSILDAAISPGHETGQLVSDDFTSTVTFFGTYGARYWAGAESSMSFAIDFTSNEWSLWDFAGSAGKLATY